jgi:hypothetical protein
MTEEEFKSYIEERTEKILQETMPESIIISQEEYDELVKDRPMTEQP